MRERPRRFELSGVSYGMDFEEVTDLLTASGFIAPSLVAKSRRGSSGVAWSFWARRTDGKDLVEIEQELPGSGEVVTYVVKDAYTFTRRKVEVATKPLPAEKSTLYAAAEPNGKGKGKGKGKEAETKAVVEKGIVRSAAAATAMETDAGNEAETGSAELEEDEGPL